MTNENILYAYAGITQGERVSDIIPGTALYIETAAYQFPTGDSKNNHGMSHNSNELYNVALKPCGESKVLSFDSYINEIMPSWLPFNGGGGKRVQWAGAIDFFFKTVRLPYARLVLPESYMLSDSRDSASNADNAIILLCDDIKQLNATAKVLTETPAAEISIPNILLRGRAGVRLTHSIMYNSCVTNVPIGTRLFEIIPAFSPFKNQNIRFMRQTPFGLRCVHTKLFDEATLSQMLLMAGDIIEVL